MGLWNADAQLDFMAKSAKPLLFVGIGMTSTSITDYFYSKLDLSLGIAAAIYLPMFLCLFYGLIGFVKSLGKNHLTKKMLNKYSDEYTRELSIKANLFAMNVIVFGLCFAFIADVIWQLNVSSGVFARVFIGVSSGCIGGYILWQLKQEELAEQEGAE